ncbi:MAG TPA: phosphoglycerate mutase family protein, partial [Gemmatimonadaceae bacterium]|nr:phosphoglycerate mutase family protein [Gemmatimonadaceae bacterium]
RGPLMPFRRLSLAALCLAAGTLLVPPRAGIGQATSVASGADAGSGVVVQPPAARAAATTVIVVRHAEKAAVPGDDPPLSAAGEARARALRDALRGAGVQAAVVTQLQRTRLTAAPLAAALGLAPEVVPVRGDVTAHARAVAARVLERHAGQTVLVVGHSNTVPAIVEALGGDGVGPIDDRSYDDLFIVVRQPDGEAHVVHARYGSPAPAPADDRAMTPPAPR